MSIQRLVATDRFDDPPSLTDLFETDALLDALGGREASYADLLELTGQPGRPDRAVFLLRALTESLDSSLTELAGVRRVAALGSAAAGSPSTTRLLQLVPASCAEPAGSTGSAGGGGSAFLRVAGRAVPRHLPRANRFVAAAAGAMIVLSGGGLAAAATTSPGHGWGPLAPLSRVFHPGSTDDGVAAKRAVVLRELERAVQQSRSGQKGAAAATYGVASRRAHDLPSGPDSTLQAQMAAVAQQLGLTTDPTTAAPVPVATTVPVAVDPTDPLGGTLPTTPPPDDGSVAPPTSGAAPGTLPPAPPTDAGAPSSTEPGTGSVGGTPPTDPTTPPVTTPPPSTLPVGPGAPVGSAPVGVGSQAPSGAVDDGPTAGTTDPTAPTAPTDPTSPPATGTTDPTSPPATGTTDPTTPPTTGPTTPGNQQPGHHHGRHRQHPGKHRNPPPGTVVDPGTPVVTPPADSTADPAATAPPATDPADPTTPAVSAT